MQGGGGNGDPFVHSHADRSKNTHQQVQHCQHKYDDHEDIDHILLSSSDASFVQMFFVNVHVACTKVAVVFLVDPSFEQRFLSH